MNKKYIVLIIIILSIIAILVGLFYPESTNKPKSEDKLNCVITKEKEYYRVEYNSDYDNYSVVDGIYEAVDSKDNLDKKLNKINCDTSKIDVDFSKDKLVIMEVLTNPKLDVLKVENKTLSAFVLYDLDLNEKRYNLYLVPVKKNIENLDVRISSKKIVEGQKHE